MWLGFMWYIGSVKIFARELIFHSISRGKEEKNTLLIRNCFPSLRMNYSRFQMKPYPAVLDKRTGFKLHLKGMFKDPEKTMTPLDWLLWKDSFFAKWEKISKEHITHQVESFLSYLTILPNNMLQNIGRGLMKQWFKCCKIRAFLKNVL